MDQLQKDLNSEFPQLDIQLLGVNQVGQEFGNATFTDGVDLPWLQDVDADSDGRSDTWTAWGADERDVIILDPQNHPVATYNLTSHDLSEAENYETLKNLLVDIASSTQQTGTISGHTYFDVNDNGLLDEAELRIGGVTISLTGTTSNGTSVEQVTVTETDGSFAFQGLAAGTYVISQSQPIMTLDGQDTTTFPTAVAHNDSFTIELGVGQDATGFLFGERGRLPETIGLGDFLASSASDGVIVATDSDTTEWYCLRGEWADYWHAEFAVTPTTELQSPPAMAAAFRDVHGHRLEADWPSPDHMLLPLHQSGDRFLLSAAGALVDVTQAERDAQAAEGESADPTPSWAAAVDWLLGQDEQHHDWDLIE